MNKMILYLIIGKKKKKLKLIKILFIFILLSNIILLRQ